MAFDSTDYRPCEPRNDAANQLQRKVVEKTLRRRKAVVLLLFGPPGCGKGTQARQIVDLLHLPAISTGDLLRSEMAAGTELGRQTQAVIAAGQLVGDHLINPMLAKRVQQADCAAGFLLDGYPRTLEQAMFLDCFLASRGISAPLVIHIDVPAEMIVGRITSRRSCPQCKRIYNVIFQPPASEGICDDCHVPLIIRNDDREDVIRERLRTYEAQTAPVIEHYRTGSYHAVDGSLAPSDVFHEIEAVLSSELAISRP
jgi:adenylate kinase